MKPKIVIVIGFIMFTLFAARDARAQWVLTNWDGCTITTCLLVSGANTSSPMLFAGSDGCGVELSTDNGTNWTNVSAGLSGFGLNVNALAVHGSDLFAGTEDGVFVSTDNGTIWNPANAGLPQNTTIAAFAVSATNGSMPILFASTEFPKAPGVFRSTDNGTGWQAVNTGLKDSNSVHAFAVIAANTSSPTIFSGTNNDGVFLSTNNGTTWNSANTGLTYTYGVLSFAVLDTNSASPIVFAGTWENGVFRSTDNGTSWNAEDTGLTDLKINCFAVSGTNLFAGMDSNIFLSTDSGATWGNVSDGLYSIAQTEALAVSGTNLFVLAVGGDNLGDEIYSVWRRPLSDFNQSGVAEGGAAPAGSGLRVFPNPATDELQIMGGEAGTVHLFDLMGRERMNAMDDGANTTLDVSRLEAGMYFLRLGIESVRVVVQH